MSQSTQPRFSLFDELDRGLNLLVNEVLHGGASESKSPALSIYDLEESYVVECDLPGVEMDDIELQLEDGILSISGARKPPFAEEAVASVNERSFERFSRTLSLGKDVDIEGVDAAFGNGVLRVTVRKVASATPKQIQVRKSES